MELSYFQLPYSGKFSLGSYFRDFADYIQSRENKNRNNLLTVNMCKQTKVYIEKNLLTEEKLYKYTVCLRLFLTVLCLVVKIVLYEIC